MLGGSSHPIFIGGTGRSGTTLVGKIFSYHRDIITYQEPGLTNGSGVGVGIQGLFRGTQYPDGFLEDIKSNIHSSLINSLSFQPDDEFSDRAEVFSLDRLLSIFSTSFIDSKSLGAAILDFLNCVYEHGMNSWGKRYWVDKTPYNMRLVDILYFFYPDFRFIHVIRDPKDIACSVMERAFGPDDVPAFIKWYTFTMTEAFHLYSQIPTKNYLVTSLENLTTNPSSVVGGIFDFVDIPLSSSDLARVTSPVSMKSAHHGRWQGSLSVSEERLIDTHCGAIYNLWKAREMVV